jgi:hypothetical protein
MSRKRYLPQEILQKVIAALERDDNWSHQRAVLDLLRHGPLFVDEATVRGPQMSTVSEVRAELLRFLRVIVGGGYMPEIATHRSVTFEARAHEGRVSCEVRGDGRDLVILQLVTLLQIVGLPSIRVCPAPNPHGGAPPGAPCGRLFVKTYRRTYCSSQCQKRAYMRQRRQNERLKREQAARRRLIQKGA